VLATVFVGAILHLRTFTCAISYRRLSGNFDASPYSLPYCTDQKIYFDFFSEHTLFLFHIEIY